MYWITFKSEECFLFLPSSASGHVSSCQGKESGLLLSLFLPKISVKDKAEWACITRYIFMSRVIQVSTWHDSSLTTEKRFQLTFKGGYFSWPFSTTPSRSSLEETGRCLLRWYRSWFLSWQRIACTSWTSWLTPESLFLSVLREFKIDS